jgi:hypothetical protein
MPELSPDLTPVTLNEMTGALIVASKAANIEPTAPMVATLLGQIAVETGDIGSPDQMIRCFQLGNSKATDRWIARGGSYCFYSQKPPHAEAPVTENLSKAWMQYSLSKAKPRTDGGDGLDMVVKRQNADGTYYCLFWPSHKQARFRAFETLADGAATFMAKFVGKFAPALPFAKRGDVTGYVATIHALKYFTADCETYTSSVQGYYRKYLPAAKAALAGPFDHLPDLGVLSSRLEDLALHPAGMVTLKSGVKISNQPLIDKSHPGMFAHPSWQTAAAWAREHGYRLPTPAEIRERWAMGPHVKPYPLPTPKMCRVEGVPYNAKHPLYKAYHTSRMRSERWCAIHDATVQRVTEAGDGAAANTKHHYMAECGIYGAFRSNGQPWQGPYCGHLPIWTSYMLTTLVVEDPEAPEPVPASHDSDTLDASMSHGERIAAWVLAHVGIAEKPLGSNRGPEVSAWLKPCQRDGYGPEFGAYLAAAGANWCAALACAAEVATRLPDDPPAVHAYRCSGIELENDAKACGAWRDIALLLSGDWVPQPGDFAIYKSGAKAWRRHVVVAIKRTGAMQYRGGAGNEGNKVTDADGRRFDHPKLLGFVEQPRVDSAGEPLNVDVIRRAVELERDLWQGVVGIDAFDKLKAELEEADPRDDGV